MVCRITDFFVLLHSDWGNLIQDILEKEEALCLSCSWKRRKFHNEIQEWHSGSHAYSVGCYFHICISGFLRPPTINVVLQFHASCLIMVLMVTGEHLKRME